MSAEEMRAIEENIRLEEDDYEVVDYSSYTDAIIDYQESYQF